MDFQNLPTLISTLGFPIVCVGACFWYIYKQDMRHDGEVDKMRTALENNTLVIQKLIDTIGKGVDE